MRGWSRNVSEVYVSDARVPTRPTAGNRAVCFSPFFVFLAPARASLPPLFFPAVSSLFFSAVSLFPLRHRSLRGVTGRLGERGGDRLLGGPRRALGVERVEVCAERGAKRGEQRVVLAWREPWQSDGDALVMSIHRAGEAGGVIHAAASSGDERDHIERERDAEAILVRRFDLQRLGHEQAGVLDVPSREGDLRAHGQCVAGRSGQSELTADRQHALHERGCRVDVAPRIRRPASPEQCEDARNVVRRRVPSERDRLVENAHRRVDLAGKQPCRAILRQRGPHADGVVRGAQKRDRRLEVGTGASALSLEERGERTPSSRAACDAGAAPCGSPPTGGEMRRRAGPRSAPATAPSRARRRARWRAECRPRADRSR